MPRKVRAIVRALGRRKIAHNVFENFPSIRQRYYSQPIRTRPSSTVPQKRTSFESHTYTFQNVDLQLFN